MSTPRTLPRTVTRRPCASDVPPHPHPTSTTRFARRRRERRDAAVAERRDHRVEERLRVDPLPADCSFQ
jgi:hypothetical protein